MPNWYTKLDFKLHKNKGLFPDVPELPENKDIDLRVLPVIEKPATIAQKRSSTETLEGKTKKNKLDKFDM